MSQKYSKKMNVNLSGTSFTDESHDSVGASSFSIDHDFFINDTSSGDVLVIRTAAAGGGTLLVQDVDYSITNQHLTLSDEDHVNKAVYSDITIINAAYQATTLYFSGKYVADSVDENDISQVTWQYEAKTATETLAPDTYTTYGCAAGANGIKLTLPAVSEYYKNIRLEFIKTDDTDTAVMIDGSGAETINGLTHVLLIEQYQKIIIMCTGTAWLMLPGSVLYADSGWINRSDWTNVHCGTTALILNDSTGFIVGEKISGGTSLTSAIVAGISGNTLYCWRVNGGTNNFTNGETITGAISSATDTVNGNTKDVDSNFYHGWGKSFWDLNYNFIYSVDGTEANAQDIISAALNIANGLVFFGVDSNNFKVQTEEDRICIVNDNGTPSNIQADDDYYRIVAKLII